MGPVMLENQTRSKMALLAEHESNHAAAGATQSSTTPSPKRPSLEARGFTEVPEATFQETLTPFPDNVSRDKVMQFRIRADSLP